MGLGSPSASTLPKAMYLHIPFCEYLCDFCPFLKFLKTDARVEAYLRNLKLEIDLYASTPYFQSAAFGSLYMGGGTASSLSTAQLVDLVSTLKTKFRFVPDAELTLESNPNTVNPDKLRAVREAGINRISYGVQTFDEALAKTTDVDPSAQRSMRAIEEALEVGFTNISIDLIYNLPGQSLDQLRLDLETAHRLGVGQVSLFPLAVVPKTALFQQIKRGKVVAPGNLAHQIKLFQEAKRVTAALGYRHQSVPDFRKDGVDYRHSEIHFRDLEDLLGLGTGGMGVVNDYIYVNIGELDRYQEHVRSGMLPINAGIKGAEAERPNGAMALGLRRLAVSKAQFQERFGAPPESFFGAVIDDLIERGLLTDDDDEIRLTELGTVFAYNVAKEFISEEVGQRGQKLADGLARKRDVPASDPTGA